MVAYPGEGRKHPRGFINTTTTSDHRAHGPGFQTPSDTRGWARLILAASRPLEGVEAQLVELAADGAVLDGLAKLGLLALARRLHLMG
jgi:hypothetical protein